MARAKPEIIYENTIPGIFVQRNNRFTAEVMVGNEQKTVHINNTGRLDGRALAAAAKAGVEIIYHSCHVEADSIKITGSTLDMCAT